MSAPIPAEAPIGGPLWSLGIPALLLLVSIVATWLLYRHFANAGREGDADSGTGS